MLVDDCPGMGRVYQSPVLVGCVTHNAPTTLSRTLREFSTMEVGAG